jgi:hypothetical protein
VARVDHAADVGDVDSAGAVGDRQLPETSIHHGSRRIADTRRCGNGCRTGGQQVMDPGLVHIHAVGHRPGDIGLGITPTGRSPCRTPNTTKAADLACFIK